MEQLFPACSGSSPTDRVRHTASTEKQSMGRAKAWLTGCGIPTKKDLLEMNENRQEAGLGIEAVKPISLLLHLKKRTQKPQNRTWDPFP